MDALRDEAGVSLKRIYALYPSKEALVEAALIARRAASPRRAAAPRRRRGTAAAADPCAVRPARGVVRRARLPRLRVSQRLRRTRRVGASRRWRRATPQALVAGPSRGASCRSRRAAEPRRSARLADQRRDDDRRAQRSARGSRRCPRRGGDAAAACDLRFVTRTREVTHISFAGLSMVLLPGGVPRPLRLRLSASTRSSRCFGHRAPRTP